MQETRRKGMTETRTGNILLALVFVLILALVFAYSQSSRRQLEEYAAFTVQEAAERISQEVDADIVAALNSIQLTAREVEQAMNGRVLENAGEVLAPMLERTPFELIEYIKQDGTNITELGERFDASDRVYYIEGMAGHTPVWINYHPKYAKEYLLDFYTPLEKNGEIVGVLTGALGADTSVLPLLDMRFFGEDMIGMVCDREGGVISATFEGRDGLTLEQVLVDFGISEKSKTEFREHIAGRDGSVFEIRGVKGRSIACVIVNERTGWSILQVVPAASFAAVMRGVLLRAYGVMAGIILLLSLYVLHVVIGARRQRAMKQEKERQLAEQVALSNTDRLTGMLNRRAYEDDLMTYPKVPTEEDYVYVSVDVNGLKVTNDELGHAAGDELLIGAARCLEQCLGAYGRIYRTGGDEFVAQIFADEEHRRFISRDLEETSHAWRGKLVQGVNMSVGMASKREFPGVPVVELAKIADDRMYKAKAAYYAQKGVDRRGQQTAYAALCSLYTKILRVNLTTDEYRILAMDERERSSEMGFNDRISAWLHDFGVSGQVHPDDLVKYLDETDIDHLRGAFGQDRRHLSIFYRRRAGEAYREVMMEMIPAEDYAEDNQTLYLYVKDIDRMVR